MSEKLIRVDGAIAYSGYVRVDVGGAVMFFPTDELKRKLRYGRTPNYYAASVSESYAHLVLGCTLKEALRRIRIMRKALKAVNAEYARRASQAKS